MATKSRPDSALCVQLEFDYAQHEITPADAKPLEKHAKVITETQDRVRRTTAEGVLKIGAELAAARDRLANHGNGTFGKWCKERCGITPRTAQYAIAAAQQFKDCETISQFDATALYLLSAESCPDEATQEALERAEAGEAITTKVAKRIIKDKSPETDDEQEDEVGEDDLSDALEWSPVNCLTSIRHEVKRWLQVCPKNDIAFIRRTLSDIAAQIEDHGNE